MGRMVVLPVAGGGLEIHDPWGPIPPRPFCDSVWFSKHLFYDDEGRGIKMCPLLLMDSEVYLFLLGLSMLYWCAFKEPTSNLWLLTVCRCKWGAETPNPSKTVLVQCKEVSQLLVIGKTHVSQTEPGCETPSTLHSPCVKTVLADLDLESVTESVCTPLLGLLLLPIIRKQGMEE